MRKKFCTRLYCTTYGPNHYNPCQHCAGVCYFVVVSMTKCLTRSNFIMKKFASLVFGDLVPHGKTWQQDQIPVMVADACSHNSADQEAEMGRMLMFF